MRLLAHPASSILDIQFMGKSSAKLVATLLRIRTLIKAIPRDRQTMMFSATWPREVRNLAQDYLHQPVYIQIGSHEATANKDITQEVVICSGQREKSENLLAHLVLPTEEKAGQRVPENLRELADAGNPGRAMAAMATELVGWLLSFR
eukprot:Skav224220  [mRNA]  locus=scaffold939:1050338:1057025:- [translate_table: standard]